MIRLRKLISARDNARRGAAGQVGTFLIILMVIVLIMGLFLTNLGQLSAEAVTVTNAADASTLFLASQLATRSNQLCKALSEKSHKNEEAECDSGEKGVKFCQKTGLFAVFLAIVTVALLAIFAPGALLAVGNWLIPGAVVAGAPGAVAVATLGAAAIGAGAGLTGAAIAGTGLVQGALIGAGVGAGIASGAQFFGKLLGVKGGVLATGKALTAAGYAAIGVATVTAGGGPFYAQLRGAHRIRVAVGAISQQINSLPDYEKIREGALLQALSRAVEDPNTTVGPSGEGGCFFPEAYGPAVGDPFDINGDGDKTEAISCFDYWWSVRVNLLQTMLTNTARDNLVYNFMEGPLKDRRTRALKLLYYLERSEAECSCTVKETDGPAIQVWRRLQRAGYKVADIWQPGPTKSEVKQYIDDPCDPACPNPPGGWDSADEVRLRYERFVDYANSLIWNPVVQGPLGFSTKGDWYKHLASSVENWLPTLYGAPYGIEGSFYEELELIRGQISNWIDITLGEEEKLPNCHLAYGKYTPQISRQQLPPSTPICANIDLFRDPDTGVSRDLDPIYNCTWYDDPFVRETTGVYLPTANFDPAITDENRPLCKVDEKHNTALLNQIAKVDGEVVGLKAFIEREYASHFVPNPDWPGDGWCPAPPPGDVPSLTCVTAGGDCGGSSLNCCSQSCARVSACTGKAEVGERCSVPADCCSGACSQPCTDKKRLGEPCNPKNSLMCCSGECDADRWQCIGTEPSATCQGVDPTQLVCQGPDPVPSAPYSKRETPLNQMRVKMDGANNPMISLSLKKWDGGPAPDNLDYRYTYTYECRTCVKVVLQNGFIENCNHPWPVERTDQRTKEAIGAPDLAIPTGLRGIAAYMDYASFRGVLTQFRDAVGAMPELYGTIDADLFDEFEDVLALLDLDHVTDSLFYRTGIPHFLGEVRALFDALNITAGGAARPADDGRLPNPEFPIFDAIRGTTHPIDGLYEWQDSRGIHSINVEIGPFIQAKTEQKKYKGFLGIGFLTGKTCIEMRDYCDNTADCPYRGPDRTWVRISRRGPTDRPIGFWRWNPFGGVIRKTSRGSYDRLFVGICGTSGIAECG